MLALVCVAALGLSCFGGVLFRDHQFAFRDAAAYYYPLNLRVQQEWNAGRWPLWAPEANGGMPLLGNPTCAVLYPGKFAFFLLPYAWAARVYIILHVILAAAATYAMLRAWRVSTTGALLGGMAYGFGAPVMTQACNVIFLVGASWIPLGFLAADRWLRLKRRGAIPALAAVLTMQVLGGDPEAAYLTVIFVSAYAVGLVARSAQCGVARVVRWGIVALAASYFGLLGLTIWSARAAARIDEGSPLPWSPMGALVAMAWTIAAAVVVRRDWKRGDWSGLTVRMGGLVAAAALAVLMSGAQILPVVEFTRQSFRANERVGFHNAYPFGVHPLHLLDTIWPNLFGTLDRGNRAWSAALPPLHDDRIWLFSLYMGGLTLIFALSSMRFRGAPDLRMGLSWLALVSLLAALGIYASPIFWARCVPGWEPLVGPVDLRMTTKARPDGLIWDGDSSVYWFLKSALPGFRLFRYPAKLTVFTALAVSGLAGAGWDDLVAARSRRIRFVAAVTLTLSLMALAATWVWSGFLRRFLQNFSDGSNSVQGPLDIPGAFTDLRIAICHGVLNSAAALVLVVMAARRPKLAAAIAIGVLACDLSLANPHHLLTAPQSAFEATPRMMKVIQEAEKDHPSPGPFRVQRIGNWFPTAWFDQGTPRRVEEVIRWERDTLKPKYPLTLGLEMTSSVDSIDMVDYASFFFPMFIPLTEETAPGTGLKVGDQICYQPRRAFDIWNTRYFIVPSYLEWDSTERGYASVVPKSTQIYPPPDAFKGPGGPARRSQWETTDDVRVLRNERWFPRACIVHRARLVAPLGLARSTDRDAFMRDLLYNNDDLWRAEGMQARDLRSLAWVETDHPRTIDPMLSRAEPDPAETVTVDHEEPQRVELTATLRSSGLVVASYVYYPGWTLTVDGEPAEILRTNRAMRGVAVPAGTHKLVFRYDPLSFRAGMGVSVMGLIALLGFVVWARRAPNEAGSTHEDE